MVSNPKSMEQFIDSIGRELTLLQVDNLVVMTTSLVASTLLMYRKGISMDLLVKRVIWLYDELKFRKVELSLGLEPTKEVVETSLSYLKNLVERKRDIIVPQVHGTNGPKNLLMLAYYRNNLSHVFVPEALIACSILS